MDRRKTRDVLWMVFQCAKQERRSFIDAYQGDTSEKAVREALKDMAALERLQIAGLLQPDKAKVEHLSRQLNIHPAIIAGRIRFRTGNYRILNNVVGHQEVRKWFAGETGGW